MKSDSLLMALPVAELGLSMQSSQCLGRLGIKTIGDLAIRLRIAGFGKSNLTAAEEAAAAIRGLLKAATVDWHVYDSSSVPRPFLPMLPSKRRVEWSASDFLADLPAVLTDVIKLQFQSKHMSVLKLRLLARPDRRMTQGALGVKLGVTRKRIQAIEKRMVDLIRRALLKADYRRCRFTFQPAFAKPLRNLVRAVEAATGSKIPASEVLRQQLRAVWRLKPEQVYQCEALILQLLTGRSPKETPADGKYRYVRRARKRAAF